jgi:hypothetical protein
MLQKARQSSHRFPSNAELQKALLYNYQPVPGGGYFDQVYAFPLSASG